MKARAWLGKTPLAVLQQPSFRNLWLANLFSQLGSNISRVGLILWFARSRAAIPVIGLLVCCETLPGWFAGFVAGTVVDRGDKRIIMVAADLARMAALVPAVLYPSPAVLYAVVALHSLLAAFFTPARSAAVALTVEGKSLTDANALDQAAFSSVMILGPLSGAWLFVSIGLRSTLLLDALSFLLSGLLIMPVIIRKTEVAAARQAVFKQMRQGWAYLAGHGVILHIVSLVGVSLLCVALWIPIAPLFLKQFLHVPDSAIGLQFGLFGLGSILGSFAAPPLVKRLGRGRAFAAMLLAEASIMLVYSMAPLPVLSHAIILAWGMAVSVGVVPYLSLLQQNVQEAFLGRVFAVARQVESIATVAAIAMAVVLQSFMPPQSIFAVAAFAYLGLVASSLMLPSGRKLLQSR